MSTTKTGARAPSKRETWGSLRKLPSGRWQARYPAPDGETYTARTEDDKPLTFVTKTDARTWLAAIHTKIARQEPPPNASQPSSTPTPSRIRRLPRFDLSPGS
ncbi:hypothetical protein ACTU6U_10435 [Microbacterium sp. A196]|uniref:hypothetical protein n=1 Tax=Microbacterium sp. A196 TaxID=3457320 RepID=UPI003FD3F1F0